MKRVNVLLSAILLIAITASSATAGDVLLVGKVVARYDNAIDFNVLPLTSPPGGPITDGPGLYQVDMTMEVENLAANEKGFGSLSFDVTLSGDLSIGGPYQPESFAMVDVDGIGFGPLQPKWATNTDGGIPGDWKGILLAAQGGTLGPFDPRDDLGDPDPEYFGSFYVLAGPGAGEFAIENFQFSIRQTNGLFGSPQLGTNSSILWQVPEQIPEPTCGVLAVLAALGLVGFGRRR